MRFHGRAIHRLDVPCLLTVSHVFSSGRYGTICGAVSWLPGRTSMGRLRLQLINQHRRLLGYIERRCAVVAPLTLKQGRIPLDKEAEDFLSRD